MCKVVYYPLPPFLPFQMGFKLAQAYGSQNVHLMLHFLHIQVVEKYNK